MQVVIDGIIFESHANGGVVRIFEQVLPELCTQDPNVKIELIVSGKPKSAMPTHSSIRPIIIPPIHRIIQPNRYFLLAQLQLRTQVQQFYLQNSVESLWHSTYYTKPPKTWKGPLVITVYDLIHEYFPGYFNDPYSKKFVEQKQRCLRDADVAICISETTKQDVIKHYHIEPSKLIVIPLAANKCFRKDRVTKSIVLPTSKPFFLYVGQRARYKNFLELIQAYSQWNQKDDLDLVVVGPKWSDAERAKLLELNIFSQTHLLHNIPDLQLSELYNYATAFVYPSQYEGFGIPILEAMACQCPIIASRIPSTVEIAKDYPIYFELDNIDSLIAAFSQVVDHGKSEEQMNRGLIYTNHYSWENTSQKTLQVYQSLQA